MSPTIRRFFRYTMIGTGTFGLDLVFLFIFIDYLMIHPVVSAGVAFLIAVTVNYIVSRRYVFSKTKRDVGTGYVNFLIIVGVGLAVVTGGMYILVSLFGFNYLISRILIAAITGMWNYLINLYLNFKVVGKH